MDLQEQLDQVHQSAELLDTNKSFYTKYDLVFHTDMTNAKTNEEILLASFYCFNRDISGDNIKSYGFKCPRNLPEEILDKLPLLLKPILKKPFTYCNVNFTSALQSHPDDPMTHLVFLYSGPSCLFMKQPSTFEIRNYANPMAIMEPTVKDSYYLVSP